MTRRFALAALLAAIALVDPSSSRAQGTKADYERADKLRELASGKVFKASVQPHWSEDGDRFWYRNELARDAWEFVLVDAVKGERRPAFDHARLAEALAVSTSKPQSATRLPVTAIETLMVSPLRIEAEGRAWDYDQDSGELKDRGPAVTPPSADRKPRERRPPRDESPRGAMSPDGKWTAFLRDHNLHLRHRESGESFALSSEGAAGDAYESGVVWSPDSSKLVALRTLAADARKVNLIESSPGDQLQPKLRSLDYRKPGDRVPISKPHLFDIVSKAEIPIDDALFSNPWSVDNIRWAPDSGQFTFEYNQRGHQVLRILAVDASDGSARAIVDERSRTFIDYAHKHFAQHLDDTGEILWMSERDGWNHIYLIDTSTGEVKNRVTRGDWIVRQVDRVDVEKRQVWFRAGGIIPGQDPYYVHFARVNFDGSGLVVLTEGDGTHQVEPSPDGRFLLDTYSRVDMPPVVEVRSSEDGKLVCELERADWSALREAGWKAPERFAAKGRDGQTDIFGVIFRPSNFDPEKKYPVIEQIYAGPQGSFVPKRFDAFHDMQALAELGFVVVQIDGMGTSNRSKAFHDVCWKNLGDAGFPDRILWLKAAAEKEPAMDLSRVGIYGGSAGGQNALGALLFHGDFYKAASADCGCHDNRMDKIWWNELWMGWPVGPHYAAQSNVTNAHKLTGKLLLFVGELDENVDPASTMQVVNALIKADKDFDFVMVPGAGHGAGGGPYGRRRMRDFFVRNLLGVEPRRDN